MVYFQTAIVYKFIFWSKINSGISKSIVDDRGINLKVVKLQFDILYLI